MKSLKLTKSEEGITLVKYLKKVFKTMPNSLFQKLLRKKYFEINNKKAGGNEILHAGDVVSIYLSDETFEKFYDKLSSDSSEKSTKSLPDISDRIVYEDDNVIIFNKPVGMLSQGDKSGDESVNTVLNKYLGIQNSAFKASVVNRLDRNTEGLIIFAKTYVAAREISKMIKNGLIEKRYKATINGILEEDSGELVNLFKKDERDNKAIIKEYNGKIINGYSLIKLKYKVIKKTKATEDIDIDLITGKSHQIRAQFSYIGHPLISDKKYMDLDLYRKNVKESGLKSQKLICYKIKFGKFDEESLNNLSNKIFKI